MKWYTECQLSIFNPNVQCNKFLKIDEELQFPKTKKMIKEYWDDATPLSKREAYMWYRILSDQIHANLLFEGYEVATIDFQLLSFLIILHLKFLKSLKGICSSKLQKEIDDTINEIISYSEQFSKEWKIKKTLTER